MTGELLVARNSLLVTRVTLRQGFGWQAPPPVARSATPPARIPPTQTMFARGPGAVGIGAFSSRGYVAHDMGGG